MDFGHGSPMNISTTIHDFLKPKSAANSEQWI